MPESKIISLFLSSTQIRKLTVSIVLLSGMCLFHLSVQAQPIPALPPIVADDFVAEIKEQVGKAYAEAQAKPRDAQANGQLGMILQAYEYYEFALTCYERARLAAPQDFRWLYYSGIAQAALGKHQEAVTAFKAALQQQPDYQPAQLRLAESLLAVGQLTESQGLYTAIIKQNDKLVQAHYGLGRIKAAQGDAGAAVEHYRKALELFPQYGAAHYALGMALRDLQQKSAAQEHLQLSQQYKQFFPILPDPVLANIAALNANASEQLKRGLFLEKVGQLEESIAAHERALELNPQLVQAHINLISLCARAGQLDKAEKHYRAALKINPNLADLHYNFGVLLVELERYKDAAQAFYQSLTLNPFNAEAHHNYASMIEQEGRLDEAAKHYRLALENNPNHRFAHFHLGRILVNQGQMPQAIEHFLQTLTPEDESTARFTYALGATYVRAGNRAKGIEYIRAARDKAQQWKQSDLVTAIERDLRILGAQN